MVFGSVALSLPNAWAGGCVPNGAPGWAMCTTKTAQGDATAVCKGEGYGTATEYGNGPDPKYSFLYMCSPGSGTQQSSTSQSSGNPASSANGGTSQNLLGGPGSGTASGSDSTLTSNNPPIDPGLNTTARIPSQLGTNDPAPPIATNLQMGNNSLPNLGPVTPPNVTVAPPQVDPGLSTAPKIPSQLGNNDPAPQINTNLQMGNNSLPNLGSVAAPNVVAAPPTTDLSFKSGKDGSGGTVNTGTVTGQGGGYIQMPGDGGAYVQVAPDGTISSSDGTQLANGINTLSDGSKVNVSNMGIAGGAVATYTDPGSGQMYTINEGGSTVSGGPTGTKYNVGTNGATSNLTGTSPSTGGQQATGSAAVTTPPTAAAAGTNPATAQNQRSTADNQDFKADGCTQSGTFDMTNCKGTQALMTTTQVMVVGGQMAGSTTLNTMGQSAQQNLLVNGASQSGIYQSSIDMAKDAAKAQIALGTTQLAMGYIIHTKANTANSNVKALNTTSYNVSKDCPNGVCTVNMAGGTSGNSAITGSQAARAFNQANAKDASELADMTVTPSNSGATAISNANSMNAKTAGTLAGNATNLTHAALTEQKTLGDAASTSALTNMITGGQALLSGAFAWRNADAEQNLLNKLNGLPVAAAPSADPFNTLGTAGSPTTITGDGITGSGSGASAGASPAPMASGPLGNALGNAPDNSIAAAPITPDPGAGNSGSNDIPSGGGVSGGAIGTSAAPAGSDAEPQAKYADNGKGVAGYESAGMAPGGGGGKGSGSGSDTAINPKDLLAAMMDQMNGKKDEPTGQDILAYGRSPASDAPFAPLPKNEDVFGYIHKAYQGLQRKSRVGLN